MNLRDLTDRQIKKCQKEAEESRKKWMQTKGRMQMSKFEVELFLTAYSRGFSAGLKMVKE